MYNEQIKEQDQTKALILFDGKSNSGKTTTLRNLIELLATDGKSPQYITNVRNSLANHLTSHGNYKDLYIIVQYQGVDIFVATESDKAPWVIAACYFFSCDYANFHKTLPQTDVFTFDSMGNLQTITDLSCYHPYLCVSACHINRGITHYLLDYSRNNTLLKEPIILRRWEYTSQIPNAKNLFSVCQYFAERLHHLIDIV